MLYLGYREIRIVAKVSGMPSLKNTLTYSSKFALPSLAQCLVYRFYAY